MCSYVIYLDDEDFEKPITVFDVLQAVINDEFTFEQVLEEQSFEAAVLSYINTNIIDDMSIPSDEYIFVLLDVDEKTLEVGSYKVELKEKEVTRVETEKLLRKI